jgi:predicted metal-dependent hydrolase
LREWWQLQFERFLGKLLPFQHLAAFVGSVLMLAAGLCASRPLRILCVLLAIILLLFVAADFARSLLDTDRYAGDEPPRTANPVTRVEIVLTVVVASTYFCLLLAGLYTLLLSSWLVLLIMVPATAVFSSLAAWRNVRLWYREGADYEQALKEEEEGQSPRLHIPPVP